MSNEKTHVFDAGQSPQLDSWFRRILQNPFKILNPYVNQGMRTIDLGCGTGYFAIPMAKMVGETGCVLALDIQPEMLDILQENIDYSDSHNIYPVNLSSESLPNNYEADFILAAYVMHELPNQSFWIKQLYENLKSGGHFLVIEPNFVVRKSDFQKTVDLLLTNGFELISTPKIFLSRSILVKKGFHDTERVN
jgi:ubiquinone/menaquinone biosynthesis C-methylase UbiE